MGNFFSGTSTTPQYVTNNDLDTKKYISNTVGDLTNYTKTDNLDGFISQKGYLKNDTANNTYAPLKDSSGNVINYAKLSQIPDVSNFITKDVNNLTNYTNTTDLNTKLNTINTNISGGNYLSYSNSDKNTIELGGDYLEFKKSGNSLSKLNKDGTFEITNLSNNTLNSPSVQFKRTDNSIKQSQILGIQSGGDTIANEKRDFLRIGSFKQDSSNNYAISPFVRFDTLTDGSGSPVSRFRAPVIFNNNLNIGQDLNYYTISTDFASNGNKCIYLKETDKTNSDMTQHVIDKPIGKWCP